jgi:hypothetical protein
MKSPTKTPGYRLIVARPVRPIFGAMSIGAVVQRWAHLNFMQPTDGSEFGRKKSQKSQKRTKE